MITCSRCNKDNQDHYKFCLGCGAKLDRGTGSGLGIATPTAAPGGLSAEPIGTAPTSPPAARVSTPLASIPLARVSAEKRAEARPSAVRSGGYTPPPPAPSPIPPPAEAVDLADPSLGISTVAQLAAPTAAPAAASQGTVCPQCGNGIAPTNTFCGKCGFRLKAVAAPAAAPAPAAGAGEFEAVRTSGGAPATGVPRTIFMAGPAAKAAARGHLTLIRPDGTEGGMHPLVEGENLIGRGQGALFDADPYLSPRHAEFVLNDGGLVVEDLRSLNGVFIKATAEEALDSGSIFRIGQELLRFDVISPPSPLEDGTEIIGTPNPGYWGRISVIVGRDVDGPAFPIFEESIVLGRERGDILFPEDGYVSATHARISLREGHVYLQDLGSSNGTFIRSIGARAVPPGSLLLMGQQLFRVQFT